VKPTRSKRMSALDTPCHVPNARPRAASRSAADTPGTPRSVTKYRAGCFTHRSDDPVPPEAVPNFR